MLDINVNVPVCYAVADAPTKFLYWPTTTTYIHTTRAWCYASMAAAAAGRLLTYFERELSPQMVINPYANSWQLRLAVAGLAEYYERRNPSSSSNLDGTTEKGEMESYIYYIWLATANQDRFRITANLT